MFLMKTKKSTIRNVLFSLISMSLWSRTSALVNIYIAKVLIPVGQIRKILTILLVNTLPPLILIELGTRPGE